jgi:hypothetical protein
MLCRFCSQWNRSRDLRCRFCGNLLAAEQDAATAQRSTAPRSQLVLPPVQRDKYSGGLDVHRILSARGTLLVIAAIIGFILFCVIIIRSTCAAN